MVSHFCPISSSYFLNHVNTGHMFKVHALNQIFLTLLSDVAATKTSLALFLSWWARWVNPRNKNMGSCSASIWQTPPTYSLSHLTSATGVGISSRKQWRQHILWDDSVTKSKNEWPWNNLTLNVCSDLYLRPFLLFRSTFPLHILRWISRGDLQVYWASW